MEFKKKLRIRLYSAIGCVVIGVLMIIISNFTQSDNSFLSSFGLIYAVCGIVRIRRYFLITRNDETIEKQRIVESDERNIAISNKAKNIAFSVYIIITCIAVIVLQFLNKQELVTILSTSICVLVFVYWISYWIINKRS
ncbi:MAG: hypothetical protein ACI4RS_02645 [Monoglobaceae bacterium]